MYVQLISPNRTGDSAKAGMPFAEISFQELRRLKSKKRKNKEPAMPDERIIQLQTLITEGCPDCENSGYRYENVQAYPCHCLQDRKCWDRLMEARIPPKYLHATLEGFEEKHRKQTEIKISPVILSKHLIQDVPDICLSGEQAAEKPTSPLQSSRN